MIYMYLQQCTTTLSSKLVNFDMLTYFILLSMLCIWFVTVADVEFCCCYTCTIAVYHSQVYSNNKQVVLLMSS